MDAVLRDILGGLANQTSRKGPIIADVRGHNRTSEQEVSLASLDNMTSIFAKRQQTLARQTGRRLTAASIPSASRGCRRARRVGAPSARPWTTPNIGAPTAPKTNTSVQRGDWQSRGPPSKKPRPHFHSEEACRKWNKYHYLSCPHGESCAYTHECSICRATDHGTLKCPKAKSPCTKAQTTVAGQDAKSRHQSIYPAFIYPHYSMASGPIWGLSRAQAMHAKWMTIPSKYREGAWTRHVLCMAAIHSRSWRPLIHQTAREAASWQTHQSSEPACSNGGDNHPTHQRGMGDRAGEPSRPCLCSLRGKWHKEGLPHWL